MIVASDQYSVDYIADVEGHRQPVLEEVVGKDNCNVGHYRECLIHQVQEDCLAVDQVRRCKYSHRFADSPVHAPAALGNRSEVSKAIKELEDALQLIIVVKLSPRIVNILQGSVDVDHVLGETSLTRIKILHFNNPEPSHELISEFNSKVEVV